MMILWADGSFGDPDVFVGGSVVEKIMIAFPCHAFDKNDVRHLSNFFPFLFGLEDWLIAAENDLARVLAIEDGHRRPIDKFVVSSVINKHDPTRCKDRWRA